jgi:response regulator of citrate/malate metabolism
VSDHQPGVRSGVRVVVVDDDFRVAAIHRTYAESIAGVTVVAEAHTGGEALAANAEHQPDLVLLDIYLPDLHGLDVARRLREQRPVDVIVITAATDVDTVRTAMQRGSLDYLVKPFTCATFRARIERYLAWRRQLSRVVHADQPTIDRLFGLLRSEGEPTTPKGLSDSTLALVEQILRDADGELTAVDVSQLAGVSRVTARRYLDYLAELGRVDITLQYGSVGRPQHRYRATR